MTTRGILWIAICLGLTACQSHPKASPPLAARIGRAHGLEYWGRSEALAGELHLEVRGAPPLDVKFLYEVSSGRTRMRFDDGTIVLFDGRKVWVSPANSPIQQAAFVVRTWPWFVVAPLRIASAPQSVGPQEMRDLGRRPCPSAAVSISRGGKDESYVIYEDPETHRVIGIGYDLPPALRSDDDDKQYAITYYSFRDVEGVKFAEEWRLWRWSKMHGLMDPVGTGRVYNLEFISPKKGIFNVPMGARVDDLPTVRVRPPVPATTQSTPPG